MTGETYIGSIPIDNVMDCKYHFPDIINPFNVI